jgi:hypothetical protein
LSRLLHCNRLKVNKYVRQHLRQQWGQKLTF